MVARSLSGVPGSASTQANESAASSASANRFRATVKNTYGGIGLMSFSKRGQVRALACRLWHHRWHYGPDFRICLTCKKVEYP